MRREQPKHFSSGPQKANILNRAFDMKRALTFNLVKARIAPRRYFLHYVPDVSGGVASGFLTFSKAFPEYQHIILSSQGVKIPSAPSASNLILRGHTDRAELARWLRHAPAPLVIVNHHFWDLVPITRRDVRRDIPIFSFLHAHDAKLRCEPGEVDRIIVFSKHFREIYTNLPAELEPTVLTLGIDGKRFVSLTPRAVNGSLVIGNITNGAAWKHSEDFVAVCLEIQKAVPAATFRFLGTKDLEAKVQDLPGFQILRPYSTLVEEYFGGIHILLHKTRTDFRETWGSTLTEAMSAAVPVVAEAKGGAKDQIVHGQTGFLCENSQDFVRYCERLYREPELHHMIGAQARAYAQSNFSVDSFRKRFEELLVSTQETRE
jgi:glycosyltransferase involved in cell wall biosynthesis